MNSISFQTLGLHQERRQDVLGNLRTEALGAIRSALEIIRTNNPDTWFFFPQVVFTLAQLDRRAVAQDRELLTIIDRLVERGQRTGPPYYDRNLHQDVERFIASHP